ncbi:MAG: serine/threonine protein kinase [bacterium]|nr:serine/threonine protein kinase [bacterium]
MPPDSAELPRALKPLLGSVVAKRYVVDGFLGMGGMAVVFSGRHATLDRKVAIKFMRPEYSLNADVSKRFDREARAASNFDHPNCIEVFDCGETKHGLKFIVMPLLEGVELGSVLGDPLPPLQAVWLGIQLLRGLEHAHGHGVVHRDLKPDNIFVCLDHERRDLLKIVDFGIAKLLDKQATDGLQTKVGAIVGTPAYMSPEQAMGTGIDARADLYSLGVILYHMLTGSAPFRAADPRGLLFQQVSMEPDPLPSSVPELVQRLVMALMAKERDDRPPTATAALAAFERVYRQMQPDSTPWAPLLRGSTTRPEASLPPPKPAQPPAGPVVRATPPGPVDGGTQIYGPEDAPKLQAPDPRPPRLKPAVRGAQRPRATPPSAPAPPPVPTARLEAAPHRRGVSESSNLDEMDAALRKFLDMQTITAEDNLRSGIFDAPEGGWGHGELAEPGDEAHAGGPDDAKTDDSQS